MEVIHFRDTYHIRGNIMIELLGLVFVVCFYINRYWNTDSDDVSFAEESLTKLLYFAQAIHLCDYGKFKRLTETIKTEFPKLGKVVDAVMVYAKVYRVFSECSLGVHSVFTECSQGVYRVFTGCLQGVHWVITR